ncbi:helix-turn-helix domain-containing protein [Oryzomicrobium sp.]|uniref:helix-turn-helix domain-containing protein n=1 Tax=Oryzomicrobium sp. TaxID=1911578 RepID=UPI002FE28752
MSEKRFASVWEALEDTPQEAASMKARAELMRGLQAWIKREALTQSAAAGLLGVTQPRVSDLVRGRINLFSTDALIDMAATAGLSPHVTLKPQRRTGRKPSDAQALAA